MSSVGARGGVYANEDQRRMKQIWRTKAWKARVQELLLAHERCEWCNGKSGVVNHRRQGYYPGYELCRREEVDIICQPCHRHWTKTGQKRGVLYDDCESCEAPVWKGRTKCWFCGGSVIAKQGASAERKASYFRVLRRCPEVRVGDVWHGVWCWPGPVEVTGWKSQEDSKLPWPLIEVKLLAGGKGEVGLPAFMFGERTKKGSSAPWKWKGVEPEEPMPPQVYLDRESK